MIVRTTLWISVAADLVLVTGEDNAPVCFGFSQLLATKSYCGLLNTQLFSHAFIKFVWVKTIQNQHKHIIG
jgi:hypothetical protein